MCGITGIWEYGASSGRVTEPLIAAMRDTLEHRGPDDAGTHLFDGGRGGFGFRRLAIVDLSPAGHQPMRGCEDKDIWLVFNGEIYNHLELREGLAERGHIYKSRSDSETIIHLYEEKGIDFVEEIEGDFGIAIWDSTREELVLSRDRLGVKPLYYYLKDGRFIFASEIRAILAHPEVTAELNEAEISDYLTFLTTPTPRTLFRNINKLPAGHRLILNRHGDVRIEQYWDAVPPENPVQRSADEHKAEILRLLRSSIKKRMMADVPFGVFLSGGVDSSANVALMAELMDRPVETFTVAFKEHEYLNEHTEARRVTKLFNTNHHEVLIGDDEMAKFLPTMFRHLDEPIADPVCVPLYYVSKLARESGTIVVQTGEGADEVFSGYSKYVSYLKLYERFWRHAERAPGLVRSGIGAVTSFAASDSITPELGRRLAAGEPLFWGAGTVFDEPLKRELLLTGPLADSRSSIHAVNEIMSSLKSKRGSTDFLTDMTYLELKLRLPELLLNRVDRITMANSIEARVPFLDHNVAEYALGIPREMKVSGNSGKHILKEALAPLLPHDLLHQKKRGFGAPIREWFRGGNATDLEEQIFSSTLVKRAIFDYDVIRRLVAEHRSGRRDWSFHLWAILNLSVWYERWIDPR